MKILLVIRLLLLLDRSRLNWLHINNSLHWVDRVLSRCGDGLSRLRTITHSGHSLAVVMLTSGSNANMANRGLELDQRMGLVVGVQGASLAIGTEVEVIADSTLVANATDVSRISTGLSAKWSIAANANVNGLGSASPDVGEMLIDWYKPMVRVNEAGILDAASAVIPVRAVKTLVTNTSDVLRELVL